jgi:hypothetical protein
MQKSKGLTTNEKLEKSQTTTLTHQYLNPSAQHINTSTHQQSTHQYTHRHINTATYQHINTSTHQRIDTPRRHIDTSTR